MLDAFNSLTSECQTLGIINLLQQASEPLPLEAVTENVAGLLEKVGLAQKKSLCNLDFDAVRTTLETLIALHFVGQKAEGLVWVGFQGFKALVQPFLFQKKSLDSSLEPIAQYPLKLLTLAFDKKPLKHKDRDQLAISLICQTQQNLQSWRLLKKTKHIQEKLLCFLSLLEEVDQKYSSKELKLSFKNLEYL